MKLPISTTGTTTVNELIAALLDFPPNAQVMLGASNTQDVELEVEQAPGIWVTVMFS